MTKVLVTGGAGFIASHVVDRYLALGHSVAVVDNLSSGQRAYVNPGARFYRLDIGDAALRELFERERPEVVNHHAAQISVPFSVREPVIDAQTNILGSLRLLEMSREFGVRKVIFASTGGALYGEPVSLPCDESHPVKPISPYGAAKLSVEHYLHFYHWSCGLHYTALRYGNVYGPRMHFKTQEGLVVAIFASRMLRGEAVTVDWTGEQTRDFVYAGDCASANLAALEHGSGGVYNVGTGRETSVNEIFRHLASMTGYQLPPRQGPGREGDVFRIALDASLAAAEMGWRARVELEEGLRRTVEYFRSTLS